MNITSWWIISWWIYILVVIGLYFGLYLVGFNVGNEHYCLPMFGIVNYIVQPILFISSKTIVCYNFS